MVDFRKRLNIQNFEKIVNPIDIYERLDRASDKGPLRPAQVSVLEEWHNSLRDNRDVILKLNTGQGKTLVGLLMLQSKINENKGSALYLCPNILLANQTIDQAKQFGISCVTSELELNPDFIDGKIICVTHIQKLFNGLSKFKLGAKSISIDNIVIDDAHACIEAIKDSYSIKIKNDHPAYNELLELFSTELEDQGAGTFADIRAKDFSAFLPVPYWEWFDKNSEVVNILSTHSKSDSIKFAWPIIKNILKDCLCVVSGNSIEISPYRPPLDLFGSYYKAKHRIFMSATITDDSFLIKGLGLSEETINNPLIYKGEKWSGEKMILIPSLIDPQLINSEIVDIFGSPDPKRRVGYVVLCPSYKSAKIWQAAKAVVATKDDIKVRVEMLNNKEFSETLVVVNRYDGIDLPDETCRVLILDSKPFSEDLHDRYIEFCREGSEVISVKTARMIEQGLGRSVRGEKDYSVIILTGTDLIHCVNTRDSRKYLSSQTSAQIEIGLEIAELAKEDVEDDTSSRKILIQLMQQCLKRDEGWKEFYFERMNKIAQSHTFLKILEIFSAEMLAENKYFEGDSASAERILQKVIDKSEVASVDKGWYLQEIARYLYPESKTRSNEFQIAAHKSNRYLLKPKQGMIFSKIQMLSQERVENICDFLKKFGSFEELSIVIDEIMSDLQFGVKSDSFEKAINELAYCLGFKGQRPDKEWKAGPDNLWGLTDDEYLLIECKNEVDIQRASINKDETGQMNNASAWFKRNYPGAKATRIMIISTKIISKGTGFNDEVLILRARGLRILKSNVKSFINEFKNLDFSNLSRSNIQGYINLNKLDIDSLTSTYYFDKPQVFS